MGRREIFENLQGGRGTNTNWETLYYIMVNISMRLRSWEDVKNVFLDSKRLARNVLVIL